MFQNLRPPPSAPLGTGFQQHDLIYKEKTRKKKKETSTCPTSVAWEIRMTRTPSLWGSCTSTASVHITPSHLHCIEHSKKKKSFLANNTFLSEMDGCANLKLILCIPLFIPNMDHPCLLLERVSKGSAGSFPKDASPTHCLWRNYNSRHSAALIDHNRWGPNCLWTAETVRGNEGVKSRDPFDKILPHIQKQPFQWNAWFCFLQNSI